MNNKLLITIKDTKVNAILANSIFDQWNIIFSKNYIYSDMSNNNELDFDSSWMQLMKNDISKIYDFSLIKNIYLIFNTQGTFSDVKIKKLLMGEKEDLNSIKSEIEESIPNAKLLHLSSSTINYNSEIFKFINYELINREFYDNVMEKFVNQKIKISKCLSTMAISKMSFNNFDFKNKNILSITIDEKHTSIKCFKSGTNIFTINKAYGMSDIYKNISDRMNISYLTSKKLVNLFGDIPPESVVDNRYIFSQRDKKTGLITPFTKKDLSYYITEIVNKIFADLKIYIKNINLEEKEIIFSGEILKLTGFESYAKISLGEENIHEYKTDIISLNDELKFLTVGAFNLLEIQKTTDLEEENLEKNDFILHQKIINKFFGKIMKMINN